LRSLSAACCDEYSALQQALATQNKVIDTLTQKLNPSSFSRSRICANDACKSANHDRLITTTLPPNSWRAVDLEAEHQNQNSTHQKEKADSSPRRKQAVNALCETVRRQ
jgi:hypothetical protein